MQETQETGVQSLGQEDSTPVFLPGESHGQRSLADYSPQGRKESDMTERLHFTSYILSLSFAEQVSRLLTA